MNELFAQWKQKTSEFARLQWAYATVAVATLVLGGLISLIDAGMGSAVAAFSLYVGMLFVVNFVANSVIGSLIGPVRKAPTRK